MTERRDGLAALVDWVNGDVLRKVYITPHISGCRITLSEGLETSCSREGEDPHTVALKTIEFAERPAQKRVAIERHLQRVEAALLQAKGEVKNREREVRLLEKQLNNLEKG